MAVVAHKEANVKLLVGNAGVNRTRADCSDFKRMRSIRDLAFQNLNDFETTQKRYVYQAAHQKRLTLPVTFLKAGIAIRHLMHFGFMSLKGAGRHKSHCFFRPQPSVCPRVY